jgi:cell division protein FtsB
MLAGIGNPGNWWLYLVIIFVIVWLFKKPARRDDTLAQKIRELEEGAQRADQVLFDRVEVLERQLDKVNSQLSQETTDYEKTIHGLQDRIQILEAIVTDRRYELDREIGAL